MKASALFVMADSREHLARLMEVERNRLSGEESMFDSRVW